MKRQATKPHQKKQQTVAKGKSTPPESEARIEARQHVEKNYPIHDSVLVAEIAARLASGRRQITQDNALDLGREAIILLDGVSKAVAERAENRDKLLTSANESEEFPEHMSWSAGKKFIMKTDGRGSDEQFKSMVKDKMRHDRLQEESYRLAKLHSGGPWEPPSIEAISKTTQEEYKKAEMHYRRNGFNAWELRSLRNFFDEWRIGKDKRRKKTLGAIPPLKFPLVLPQKPLTVP